MTDKSTETFGQWLRSQREEKGHSLRSIADQTRIPLSNLEALEAGDEEGLPAPVFVKGFLRSYAVEVGLSPDEVISKYKQNRPEVTEENVAVPLSSRQNSLNYSRLWPVIPVLLMVLLLGLGVYYYYPQLKSAVQHDSTETVAGGQNNLAAEPRTRDVAGSGVSETEAASFKEIPSDSQGTAPAAVKTGSEVEVAFVPPRDNTETEAVPQPSPSLNVTAVRIPPLPQPAPAPEVPPVVAAPARTETSVETAASTPSTDSATPSAYTDGHELKLLFDQESWVQVIVDNGKTEHRLFGAGMSETWKAEKSFSLRVGNAGAVKAVLDGRELGPLGPEGRVARITLPKAGDRPQTQQP